MFSCFQRFRCWKTVNIVSRLLLCKYNFWEEFFCLTCLSPFFLMYSFPQRFVLVCSRYGVPWESCYQIDLRSFYFNTEDGKVFGVCWLSFLPQLMSGFPHFWCCSTGCSFICDSSVTLLMVHRLDVFCLFVCFLRICWHSFRQLHFLCFIDMFNARNEVVSKLPQSGYSPEE